MGNSTSSTTGPKNMNDQTYAARLESAQAVIANQQRRIASYEQQLETQKRFILLTIGMIGMYGAYRYNCYKKQASRLSIARNNGNDRNTNFLENSDLNSEENTDDGHNSNNRDDSNDYNSDNETKREVKDDNDSENENENENGDGIDDNNFENEREMESEKLKCVICLTKERNITYLPCNHLAVCELCHQIQIQHSIEQTIQNQRTHPSVQCPVCRHPVHYNVKSILV